MEGDIITTQEIFCYKRTGINPDGSVQGVFRATGVCPKVSEKIRTYGIKPGGVQPTIDLWEQAVPAREKLSPCVVAMVALDGPLRFTNIWAYASLDARSKARADAVAQGIWPPKGGPAHLTTQMVSTIAMPTAVSPLK